VLSGEEELIVVLCSDSVWWGHQPREGKVAMIEPTNNAGTVIAPTNAKPKLVFTYDPLGKRTIKQQINSNTYPQANWTYYYMLDASGNTMANYSGSYSNSQNPPGSGSSCKLMEIPIYGTDRIGEYIPPASMTTTITRYDGTMYPNTATRSSASYTQTDEILLLRYLGYKQYELKDHLGNVTATVSDRLLKPASVLYAELYSYKAYYPFGMTMPGKSFTSIGYRYGFNGKENDVETGYQDYGMRQYNPRLARFFSVDPITSHYPMLTPYQFASNSPIIYIDLDGLEGTQKPKNTGNTLIKRAVTDAFWEYTIPKRLGEWKRSLYNYAKEKSNIH
jgi:RHS repeat-associated protein